jgi:amino acid permease
MGSKSFADYWIKPFQFFNFFPTAAVMILVGGSAMTTIDTMINGTEPTLDEGKWTAVMALLVLVLSMAPDLSHVWQISFAGCIAVLMITSYCIAGSAAALDDTLVERNYGRPEVVEGRPKDFAFSVMTAFGEILFGYGFHTVLPDIQASLHDKNSSDAHSDTKMALRVVFSYSYPTYMVRFDFGVCLCLDFLVNTA